MSEYNHEGNQSLPSANFLQTSPVRESISIDAESCLEIGEMKPGGNRVSMIEMNKFRSSSTLTVCQSPQFAPSPQSGSRSVPPYFPSNASPSPTQPTSPSMISPASHPGLSAWPASKTSPRQVHSDNESSYRTILGKRGHNLLLKRSLSSTPTKSFCGSSQPNPLTRRRLTAQAHQSVHSYTGSETVRRSSSLSPYSLQYVDVNQNVVPESLHLLPGQNQSAHSHFLPASPSSRSNSSRESQYSQESLPASSSPCITSPGASAFPPGAQSSLQLQDEPSVRTKHSSGQSMTPEDSHSLDSNPGTKNSQVPLTFAQSYSNLTTWTSRIANDSGDAFLNINDEGLQLPLGISDNLLLCTSPSENQPQFSQNYSSIHQPYSSLWEETTDSEGSSKSVKETYKALPNKQLRFRKTADALQKSGLWEVAMKTGNLIRRNKELQKELDKFRADALVFLKSVIKNPQNWKMIKTLLSQALSSNPATSKASPIMTVVVSAAEAAVAAASKLDSAGSSNCSSSSGGSLSGNVSDSSASDSNSLETDLIDGHFASSKNDFSCANVEMDVK